MAAAIHASSLSEVIDLANDPPETFSSQTLPNVQQPLILYIAKVPGSKDVFLTTMKPQQKVVTAQDVQNSLYYLHVASPNDHNLLQEDSPETKPENNLPPKSYLASNGVADIARKPLLENNNPDMNRRTDSARMTTGYSQSFGKGLNEKGQIMRKPVNQNLRSGYEHLDQAPQLPPRKLLGPRSMNQRLHTVDNVALQNAPDRRNIDTRRWSEQPTMKPPGLPARPSSGPSRQTQEAVKRDLRDLRTTDASNVLRDRQTGSFSGQHCWEWEETWQMRRASEARAEMNEVASCWRNSEETLQGLSAPVRDANLSLIRRYNGEQWNVATMKTSREHTNRPHSYLGMGTLIDILTPGYLKFAAGGLSDLSQPPIETPAQNASPAKEEAIFRQRLQIHGDIAQTKDRRRPQSGAMESTMRGTRPSFESRHQSADGFPVPNEEQTTQQVPSSRGFSIESPWEGTCEFSTGLAGRSLKCKHFCPSSDPNFGPGTFSTAVSELRFNLPSSKAFGKPSAKSPDPDMPRGGKRSSRLIFSHHRQSSSFDTNAHIENENLDMTTEREDRLDLSLGQEHAGGGFGGKQAKLGKLIIEVDGLQMLDFIVAANMALWWRVYERIT